MASPSFAIQRMTLAPGVSTPIYPWFGRDVLIGNGCATDLLVYSAEGDQSAYFPILAGYEKLIEVSSFQQGIIAFWLQCSLGGPVTLTWT